VRLKSSGSDARVFGSDRHQTAPRGSTWPECALVAIMDATGGLTAFRDLTLPDGGPGARKGKRAGHHVRRRGTPSMEHHPGVRASRAIPNRYNEEHGSPKACQGRPGHIEISYREAAEYVRGFRSGKRRPGSRSSAYK
jgi:hypothetical protein